MFLGKAWSLGMDKRDVPSEPTGVRQQDIRALHARIMELELRMKAELDRKKDAKVVDLEVVQLKEAVSKHECSQITRIELMSSSMSAIQKSISNIEGSISRWKSFRLGGVLAIVLALISGATYIIRAETKADTVSTSVKRIEEDVAEMREQFEGITPKKEADEETLNVIRSTIMEALSGR
jgi:hypothetical protein